MKKNCLLLLVGALLTASFLTGCCNTKSCADSTAATAQPVKKVRTGYFIGDGCNGSGVYYWAQMLHLAPALDLTLLDAKDIQNGKLDNLDLLVIPGGSSASQYKDITEKGGDKIREFVKKGGSYVGICAGFHCTLNKPDRFRLMPYTYRNGAGGYRAKVAIDINERGAKLMDIKPGRYWVSYSRGPISTEVKEWEHGKAETLGIYRSTVNNIGRNSDFLNAPAVIYGNYGKGKVIATSFHPEMHRWNDSISMGCIYAVTGVKTAPVYPQKVYRPVRVAFFTFTVNKEPINQFLELDQVKELDVRLVSSNEFAEGILLHTDVLVLPDCEVTSKKDPLKYYREVFTDFMNRGGKVIAGAKLTPYLPKHKNVTILPSGSSFVKAALEK